MTNNPDQIRHDIERTQRELSTDVDALAEKVNPARVVERRVQRTRGAVFGMKERIMGSAGNTRDTMASGASSATSSASSAMSSAGDTIASAPDYAKQRTEGNPLAAGMIAFGAGWLLSSLFPSTSTEQQLAEQVKDTVSDKGQPLAQQLGEAASEMKDNLRQPAQDAAAAVKAKASDAAQSVKEETRSAAGDVASQTQDAKESMTAHADRPAAPPE